MELEEEEDEEDKAVAEAAATEAAKSPGFFIVGDGIPSPGKMETVFGKGKKNGAGKWARK